MLSKITSLVAGKEKQKSEIIARQGFLKDRIGAYVEKLKDRDMRGLLEAMFEDIDKESLQAEVDKERAKHKDWTASEHAEVEINSTARMMSAAAVASGASSLIPGVGVVTVAVEIVTLFVFQSRMIVKIACYFDQDPTSMDRFVDIMIGIAGTGAGASSRLMTVGVEKLGGVVLEKAIAKALLKLSEKVTARLGAGAASSIPGAGAIVGSVSGVLGATTNYLTIKSIGEITIRRYGGKTKTLEQMDALMIDVAIITSRVDGDLSADERECMSALIDNSCLDEGVKNEKNEHLEKGLSIDDLDLKVKKDECLTLMDTILDISLADGNLHYKEMQLIFEVGHRLKLKIPEINELVTVRMDAVTIDESS